MSEPKFTLGPWRWTVPGYDHVQLETEHESEEYPDMNPILCSEVCKSCAKSWEDGKLTQEQIDNGPCTTPNKWNRALIAASPELYQALEKARDYIQHSFDHSRDQDVECQGAQKIIGVINSALARARGEKEGRL